MPPSVTVLVVPRESGDTYRVGRTLRALEGTGLRALDGTRDAIGQDLSALWILRAGAWPRDPERLRFPARSRTGCPLIALGATHSPPDAGGENDSARAWQTLHETCGGDLSETIQSNQTFSAPVNSIYFEPELTAGVLAALKKGAWPPLPTFHERTLPVRCVRFAPLDVFHDERLRVAEVITSLQRGGAERVVVDLAATLPSRNIQVTVIATGRPTRSAFRNPPNSVTVAAAEGGRTGRMHAAACAARTAHADLVHAHLLSPDDLLPFRSARLPVLLTVHNARPGWTPHLESLTPEHVDLLAACSRHVEADVRNAALEVPTRTAWNGIDIKRYERSPALLEGAAKLRRQWGVPPTDIVILALANPRRQKRLHLLPEILQRLRDRLPNAPRSARDAWLAIAGEASVGNEDAVEAEHLLRDEIARTGQGSRILRIACGEDIPELLRACDALVSMSEWEGLSLAHLEALAAQRPVVATTAGGTPEIAAVSPALHLLPLQVTANDATETLLRALTAPPDPKGTAVLSTDFCRYRMAERYAALFPRTIVQSTRRLSRASTDKPDLWLVTNNFSTGGAQSSARRLLCELARRGVTVRAAVVQEQPDFPTPGRQALQKAGVRVLALPPAAPCGRTDPLAAVHVLLEAMDREDRPQTLLMWNLLQQYKVLLADLLIDVPVFDVSPGEMYFTALDKYFAAPRPGLPYRSARDYGERLAGMIVKYKSESARATEALGVKVHIIPNGVPLSPCSVAVRMSGPIVFGTLARLSPQKRLEELFASFRIAQHDLPPYLLKIAGGPETGGEAYAAELRRQAEGLRVEWLGDVQDTPAFLASLDIFVMISEPAGCPNATLEAMAAGLPVVATDHGGASEQILDGITGRLTPRGDTYAFAAALTLVAGDRALRAAWGAAGRERIGTHFSLERMADTYLSVLMAQKQHRRPSSGFQ